MLGLDAFHEQVFVAIKDKVANKNDIIEEVAKILFLETFRIHHLQQTFIVDEQSYLFSDVFNADYVKTNKDKAIKLIKEAFNQLKNHEDYVVTDDEGQQQAIFDEDTHLLLNRWENYGMLLDLIQNLPAVTDNKNQPVLGKEKPNLGDVAADVLGRVFDVFLRANFESKGGLGVYLTPAPVKQCMLQMAMHDIMTETPALLTANDKKGNPAFRFVDPTCGSYGFGTVALGYIERALMDCGWSDSERNSHFQAMLQHSFVGADSAPLMVKLARVNMALLGAPKAQIFYTQDSLITQQLKTGSFDLICTNPPFGKAKSDIKHILEQFTSDLHEPPKGKGWIYKPTVNGTALGGKPNNKGLWKLSSNNIDMSVLFVDRCLSLLKPGGRLLIVLPDGVLCNSGDRYVREYIMGKKDEESSEFFGGKAIIKAVISLPADTFKLSGTGAKTSILYLQKRQAREDEPETFQAEPQQDVFMAVADTLGYVVKNKIEDYSAGVPNDLAAISGAYVRGD